MAETFTPGLGQMKSLYGVSDPQLEEYKKLLDDNSAALKARYENPNWFNVAAGFLKPQLGGFAASLGSASQALGDWQEKQRANELPLAQMRAEIGMTNMVLGQRQGEAAAKGRSVAAAGPPGSPSRLTAEQEAYREGNVTVAGQGAGTTVQQNARTAYDAALAEYNRFKALPSAKVPQHVVDALSAAQRKMAEVGLPINTDAAGATNPVATSPVTTSPVTTEEKPKEYLPMSVKPAGDERASNAVIASNVADAAKQNEDWNTYHSNLGKLVSTPSFQGVYTAFDLVRGLDPRYVEAVTDLVRKEGGWAAVLAKGASASVSASANPMAASGISATTKVPMGDYLVAKLPDHLKSTFDVLANNLGEIDTAIQKGMVPGMGATTGGLNQSGRALWLSVARGATLLDQAQFEHNAADTLRNHINPNSITPVPDIYNSDQMKKSRAAYTKILRRLNEQYHSGTVEKKP
jgi:hypothetical protein